MATAVQKITLASARDNVVKQRLRLAAVSPVLLDVYAEDGMTLEMLMAFTVSEDHARQEQVWEAIRNGWQKEPWQIRRMLAEYVALSEDDTRAVPLPQAFRLSIEPDHGPSVLWIRDEDGGDPASVVRFALHCARLFGLGGLWGFTFARVPDRPEPDAIGGGAHLLDLGTARVLASVDAAAWLAERLDTGESGDA